MSKFSSYTGCTDSLIFSRNNRLIINNIKKKIFDHLKTLYIFILLGKNLLPKKKPKGLEYFHSTVFILYKNLVPLKSILVRSFYVEILI